MSTHTIDLSKLAAPDARHRIPGTPSSVPLSTRVEVAVRRRYRRGRAPLYLSRAYRLADWSLSIGIGAITVLAVVAGLQPPYAGL